MSEETEYLGSKEVGAESYLGPTRYRITCKCLRCGHVYKRTLKVVPKENPPCPKQRCKAAILEEARRAMEANIRRMVEAERGPGHIGDKPMVRAIDKTAEIVMHDHGLTNLKDNIRPGENMAPPLPPKLQTAADNFFRGPSMTPDAKNRRAKQMELLGRRAMAGAFRGMAINPDAIVHGQKGVSPLRSLGKEKI